MKRAKQYRKRSPSPQNQQGDLAGALLNAASDHALLMCADGTVLTANCSMAGLFRISPEQLAGEKIYDFIPCAKAEKLGEAVRRSIATRRPLHFDDALFSNQELEIRMHPLPGEDGAVEQVAVFCRDVSE